MPEDRTGVWDNGIWTDGMVKSWVAHPIRHKLEKCDRCGKRRFFFRLYDVWPENRSGFQWVCADCLIEVISDK